MTEPFIGEIQVFAFQYAPKGWALCNGQLLPISQNQALFALLGTTYGGDGRTTFALPNLQGRVPLGVGAGYVQGQQAGEESQMLIAPEMPAHTHTPLASLAAASSPSPADATWTNMGTANYASGPNTQMAGSAIVAAGGSQPHENRSPYLTVNFCIALQGIFPSRS